MEVVDESGQNGLEFRENPYIGCKHESEPTAFNIFELV
jgi:hypothetical protein